MPKAEKPSVPQEVFITGKELVAIFNSPPFLGLLFRQNQLLVRHNHAQELGFCLLRALYKPEYRIIENKSVDINSTGLGKAAAQHTNLLRNGFLSLIDTHFHPYPETNLYSPPFLYPTQTDLLYLNTLRVENMRNSGYYSSPVMCIALPVSQPPINMLLVQPTPYTPPNRQSLSGYLGDMRSCRSQMEIVSALVTWGYKAAFIHLKRDGIVPGDDRFVHQFSFTARHAI